MLNYLCKPVPSLKVVNCLPDALRSDFSDNGVLGGLLRQFLGLKKMAWVCFAIQVLLEFLEAAFGTYLPTQGDKSSSFLLSLRKLDL